MNNNARMLTLTLLGLTFGFSSSTPAQDWPQWRGPNRAAVAAGFQAPASWPDALTQKWQIEVGEGVATPALVGNHLYVYARQNGEEILRCLNASSGEELWKNAFPSLGADGGARDYSGPRCSPTVAQGKVVTFGVRGTLTCTEAASGKVLWRKAGQEGGWPQFFTSSSPVISGSLCIAQWGGEQKGGIAAYDLSSGEEAWNWTGDGSAYASPVLHRVEGTDMIVAETAKMIVGLDPADGRVLWEMPYAGERRSQNTATPILSGSVLYYSASGRGIAASTLAKQADGFSVNPLWSNPDISVRFSTPVLKQDHLYGLTERNDLFCLNAKTGATAWNLPFPSKQEAETTAQNDRGRSRGRGPSGFGSLVDAGPVLVALTPKAELIVFEPNASAFNQLASYQVAEGGTYAYPILSGKSIIVKDAKSVIHWTLP